MMEVSRLPDPHTPPIGGTSSPRRLAKLDGRTREAKRLQAIKRELTEHVGGSPSAPQKFLIQRTAIDLLRLELLDHEMATGTCSDYDAKIAHALRGTVRLALKELGMKQQKPPGPSLAEHLARKAAEREGKAA
jgi:hypothetical protein